jgi:arylsulfatase A-like enzyme
MSKKQKNILLIVIDCLRADFIYKEGRALIPTLNKLKENGFSFLNTIASTSTTTPSFASLLTGLYPFQSGVRSHSGYSLNKVIRTFPQILKEKGYNTYAEFTGPLTDKIGLSKGFDEYNFRNQKEIIHTEFGDKLLKKFDEHYKSPWFVILHIWSLHKPRIVINECQSNKYGNTLYGRALSSIDKYLEKLIEKFDDNTLIAITGDHGEQIGYSTFDRFSKKFRVIMFRIMKKIGLSKVLFAKGAREIITGHGFSVYDNLVRIPLIFYNKDIVTKGISDIQIRQIDILPTILDLVDIKYSNKVEGKSALPIMKGLDKQNRDAYIEAVGIAIPDKDEWLAGLRTDNKYKFIYYPFRQDYDEELYDLEKDPEEKNNIASKNKDLILSFRKKIEDMKTEKLTGEKLTDEDKKKIEERLKDLGYME